ncbi:MAG: Grx4 family monothiol glutaredoxin [Leptospiraceae bacterium]|nr:Grx4 family monothiol glutaredoxin [Leptospiraceae bacterium]
MNEQLKNEIEAKIKSSRVFLFMKGIPARPMCGFSAGVVQALHQAGATYDSFDVLSDENVRQGIKEYANWPTIPQLYIDGEFIGGHDIVMQMLQSGELQTKLGS